MKEQAIQARAGREHKAVSSQKPSAGPEVAAMAPPFYGIDFLDHRQETESLPGANSFSLPMTGAAKANYGKSPWPALAHATGQAIPAKSKQDKHLPHESLPVVQQRQERLRPPPVVESKGKERQTADAEQKKAPLRSFAAISPSIHMRTIAGKPLVQGLPISPLVAQPPAVDGRGAVDFLVAAKPESALVVKDVAQTEKPRFSLDARPDLQKTLAEPTKTADAPGAKAGQTSVGGPAPMPQPRKAEAVRPTIGPTPATSISAPAAASPVAARPPVEASAEPAPGQNQGLEALAEDKVETPAQEKIQEKMDAASPERAESAELAETEPEPKAIPEAVAENPVSDAESSSSAISSSPSGDDGIADVSSAETQRAGAIERAEQADQARAAQQRAEEQEQEREEAQTVPQAESQTEPVQEGGNESVELNPAEKAAGLTDVGEDVGGGEAVPAGGDAGSGRSDGVDPAAETQAPDTAGMAPEDGLGAAATLPVGTAAKALGGVGSAMDNSIQQEGERLQSEMPVVEVGGDKGGTAVQPLAVSGETGKTQRAKTASARPVPAPKPLPETPPSRVRNIPSPHVTGGAEGTLSAADAQRVQSSIQALPTTDPGLDVSAGPPPSLRLSGDADPAQIADQKQKLNASILSRSAQGAAEIAAPAGENAIRVRRPKESLKASTFAVTSGTAAGAKPVDESVAIIAEAKQGAEVRAAISRAQGEISAKKAEHQGKVAEEQSKARQQLAELQTENASQQDAAKTQARDEVNKARADWSEEQRREVAKADEKSQSELAKGDENIAREQTQADEQASRHIVEGERQAQRHKSDAETEAAARKQSAEGESQGLFSGAAAKVTRFFDKLKQGLADIFDAAKKLVRAAIEEAKRLAVEVIEKARSTVVSIIRAVGDALIAIGDALLSAFPGLRAKWRAFIESKVKAAEEMVNRLADALKRNAQKLLDGLGKGLAFMLDLHQKGMMMILAAAKSVSLGAIKFAKSVADGLGVFVALVKDIAKDPGQWLAKLAAAVKDGIKNHLWKTFSNAVKGWFTDKIEQVLGLGTTIWNILKKGGIALKEVGAMVWEGLKAAIPTALIGILIEKLVAMIVPAAGAVLLIVQGIQAAWGSVQRIIAAFGKFFTFLKAVKGGAAGPQFAEMLAAAAIVVIDFVSFWLLKKLRGPASKIGAKIKAIAKKIMTKIKAVTKKAVKWVKGKFKGVKKKWKVRKAKRKAKEEVQKKSDKSKERLDKAVHELRPKLQAILAKPVSSIIVRLKLEFWRLRYRLKRLSIDRKGKGVSIRAYNSPPVEIITALKQNRELVMKISRESSHEIIGNSDVQRAAKLILKKRKAGYGMTKDEPLKMTTSIPVAAAELQQANIPRRTTTHMESIVGGTTVSMSERQTWSSSLGHTYLLEGGKYSEITGRVSEMGGAAAVSKAMVAVQRGKYSVGLLSGPEAVKRMALLTRLAGIESARDPSELARLAMRIQVGELGRLTPKDFSETLNPIGKKGGTGTARRISRESGFDLPGGREPTQAEINAFIQMELDLAARFLESTMLVEEKIGGTVAGIERYIKKKLKDRLITLMKEKYNL